MSARFDEIQHAKLGEAVYASLCDALVSGKLRPSERLKIREIAEQMNTSVTPVRDAILHLVQDGALFLRSARDIRVRDLSLEEYLEIREIRFELEGMAAAHAAEKATPLDVEALTHLTEQNERAMRAGDGLLATRTNQLFHFKIVSIAGLPILASVLQRLWLPIGPLISESYEEGGRDMIDHHYPVVEAIRRGDANAARRAMIDDIKLGGKVIYAKKLTEAKV